MKLLNRYFHLLLLTLVVIVVVTTGHGDLTEPQHC